MYVMSKSLVEGATSTEYFVRIYFRCLEFKETLRLSLTSFPQLCILSDQQEKRGFQHYANGSTCFCAQSVTLQKCLIQCRKKDISFILLYFKILISVSAHREQKVSRSSAQVINVRCRYDGEQHKWCLNLIVFLSHSESICVFSTIKFFFREKQTRELWYKKKKGFWIFLRDHLPLLSNLHQGTFERGFSQP